MKRFSAGDWVEVRSKEEILATLDKDGCIDGMPFMPEMLEYAGKRLRVFRRAHKTCDTVNRTGGRRVTDSVHLEDARCSGAAHGGCEAACLLFWKTHWLKPIEDQPVVRSATSDVGRGSGISETRLMETTQAGGTGAEPVYSCQATLLPKFTTPLKWWDLRQYIEDVTSGNETFLELFRGATYVSVFTIIKATARRWRIHRMSMALYDRIQRWRGGVPYPRRWGHVPDGENTPVRELGLVPGELVRVRPYEEILGTLDRRNKNRGLYFDAEEVPYCGKELRVRCRVSKIIDERSGKMIPIRGGSVILDGAYCKGHYSDRRMYCPRAIFPIWRETWLERAPLAADRSVDVGASQS